MDLEAVVQQMKNGVDHLLESQAEMDANLKRLLPLVGDVSRLKEDVRQGTRLLINLNTLVSSVASKGLSLDERIAEQEQLIRSLQERIEALEKRNPPQAA